MKHRMLLALALMAVLMSACAAGATQPPSPASAEPRPSASSATMPADVDVDVSTAGAVGDHLVDDEGRTLYIFTNDMPDMSHCVGDCAANWPPFTVDGGGPTAAAGVSAELGTIERGDGTLQVTAEGWPLYFYAGDSAAGDVTGEGVGGVWYVARPDGAVPGSQVEGSQAPSSGEDPYNY